ncbi:protein aurora borealis isoform 2-T2 [Erethizon dorsatum]
MGDVKELKMQITPETPGRIPVLNPFESPSDYSNLHEQTVASPSVFKSVKLPFFTKDVIVPSPWTDHEGKQLSEYHPSKCININSDSAAERKLTTHPEKSNAACQTLLSLPVDFNLENILGDYFRANEFADQSPGNLSSSSLRRKLFLDGNGSISDSLPSASPRSPHSSAQASLEVFYSIDLSPVRCRSPLQTPGSGQFSSSPIQGSAKKYSLGSITSPSAISSPTFSPVALQIGKTSLSEQRKFTLCSPDASSRINSNGITNPCIRSSYIDGCSPIKNWSPMRLEMCGGGTPYRTSLIRIPFALETHSEDEKEKENVPSPDVSSPVSDAVGGPLRQLMSDASTPGPCLVVTAVSVTQCAPGASGKELALQDIESEKNVTVDMVDPIETADENTWSKEPADDGSLPVPDFVSGIGFSIENSQMCMSPLAESSVLPCESSNMQMDSGYNTQTGGSNIMDAVVVESYCKESDAQTFEMETKFQVCNAKEDHGTQRC